MSTDRESSRGRDASPIVWLARLGAACLVLQVYVYVRWICSDKFAATSTGADKVPDATLAWIRIWEAVAGSSS